MSSVYTVRQVNAYIKNMFTADFLLSRLQVKGEVSNLKYHSSGHIYFSLKDTSGSIRCVMFSGSRIAGLKFQLQDGMQIIVSGYVNVYERDGSYQLYAQKITQDGLGELYERYEQLKKELAEMGMFSQEYKQPIPKYIHTLGVVTAPTGAAVRDIIQISKRRSPGIQIILYPAQVQGDGAVQSIVNGIRALEKYGVDTIIIGRGGGSIEDLWAFNEEEVAHAVFDCSVPIISAVGHETDTVITDYVADLRAPTPSAGAELAVADVTSVFEMMRAYRTSMNRQMHRVLDAESSRAEKYALRLKLNSPQARLNDSRQALSVLEDRLRRAIQRKIAEDREHILPRLQDRLRRAVSEKIRADQHRVKLYQETFHRLSPYEKMDGGFGLVTGTDGRRIRNASQISQGDSLHIYFRDGQVLARAEESIVNDNLSAEKEKTGAAR